MSHREKFVFHLHPHPRRPHTSRLIVQNDAANKGVRLLSLRTMSFQLLSAHRLRRRLRSSELPTYLPLVKPQGLSRLEGVQILARWSTVSQRTKQQETAFTDCSTGNKPDWKNRRPQRTILRQPLEAARCITASRIACYERQIGEQTSTMFSRRQPCVLGRSLAFVPSPLLRTILHFLPCLADLHLPQNYSYRAGSSGDPGLQM